MQLRFTLLLIILLLPGLAHAHGPSRQRVIKEVTINASPEKVWEIIREFCSISRWNPGVTDCQTDSADQPETVRTITLQNGEAIQEKLIKHLPDNKRIQYMMVTPNDKALPVSTLGSMLTVTATEEGGSKVEYKGAFYRSFPGPNPPPELSDETAIKLISELYEGGLNQLKALAEQ